MPSTIADLSALVPPGALPVVVVRRVTGDTSRTFADAAVVRREVFTEEQHVPPARERDAWDAVSLHVVVYVHVGATRRYHALHPNHRSNDKNFRGLVKLAALPAAEQQQLLSSQSEGGGGGTEEEAWGVPIGVSRLRLVNHTKEMGRFLLPVAKIERLCVRRDFRKYKVGTLLMAESEALAVSALHVAVVALHAQTVAKNFYLRRGYVTTTGLFDECGIEHVGMTKLLTGQDKEMHTKDSNNSDGNNAVAAVACAHKEEEGGRDGGVGDRGSQPQSKL